MGFPGEVSQPGAAFGAYSDRAEPRRPLLLPLPQSLPHRSSGPTCPSCGQALGERTWGMGQRMAGPTPQLPPAPGCREDGPELGLPLWSCDVCGGEGCPGTISPLWRRRFGAHRGGRACPRVMTLDFWPLEHVVLTLAVWGDQWWWPQETNTVAKAPKETTTRHLGKAHPPLPEPSLYHRVPRLRVGVEQGKM